MICLKNVRLLDETTSIDCGFIVIDNGVIQQLGPVEQMPADLPWQDGAGQWLVPGFINSHTHVAMSFMREIAHDNPDMIESVFFPFEKTLTSDDIYEFSFPSLVAGIKSGVTSFVDHYYHIDGIAKAVNELGARGFLAETLADLGGAQPQTHDLKKLVQLSIDSGSVVLGPHAMDTVSAKYLKTISEFAKSNNLKLHLHLSQTQKERERCMKEYGKSPVEVAADCGALGPNTLAVHLITADKDDISILKDTGTYVGLCPTSQTLYEHIAPIDQFHKAGLNGALGTDCAASHDSMDIMQELRTLYLAYRTLGVKLSAKEVLKTGWSSPANWLNEKIGALKVGYYADLVLLQPDLAAAPCYEPYTHLLMSLSSRHVESVLINGQYIYENKTLKTIDENEKLLRFQKRLAKKPELQQNA